MDGTEPLLKVRFDGKAVGAGKIPVTHLLKFLANLNKALQRTGRVLKGEATDLVPLGTPISRDFWESPTLDELAESQNVKPVTDVEALLGGWPGDVDDGFEEEVLKIRHLGVVGDHYGEGGTPRNLIGMVGVDTTDEL